MSIWFAIKKVFKMLLNVFYMIFFILLELKIPMSITKFVSIDCTSFF